MTDRTICYDFVMRARAATLLLTTVLSIAATRGPDQLAMARRLYNQEQYDQALQAAQQAVASPATAASARLVIARIRLERYRRSAVAQELEDARAELRALDPSMLDLRERVELQVGLGELLYLDEQFGAAAELLEPVVEASGSLTPDAHERALDWWASALDRQAQALPATDRFPFYLRMTQRMDQELRRDPASVPAAYWLPAAARGAGDLDRAWAAASAGWVRASLTRDRGAGLRADLDRLVNEAIIPERAARLPARDRHQAQSSMTSDWENFKKIW
jgi:tetratricopeptide (TPR) repeat protein